MFMVFVFWYKLIPVCMWDLVDCYDGTNERSIYKNSLFVKEEFIPCNDIYEAHVLTLNNTIVLLIKVRVL